MTTFDTSPSRQGTDSYKWGRYPPDVLPLWVADMDFRAPEPVIRALAARVEHGVYGYPGESLELRQAVTDWLARRHGWQVPPEAVVFIPGVNIGYHLASHAFALPGGVLVQTPVYHHILHAAAITGAITQQAALVCQPDGSYSIDFAAFEAAITPQTRMFILCNPHNPVGRVFRAEELARLAEICLRHGLLICADEIHGDLVYPGHRHIPIASLDPEIARRTITLTAPSKTFNLPGLQFSVAIIPDEALQAAYQAASRGLVPWNNVMGRVAALAAYREGESWLIDLLDYLAANRETLIRFVCDRLPGIRMLPPEGTYLAWLDCRAVDLPGGPFEFFLEKAKVALEDGAHFGPGGEGFVRLNFGCPRHLLVEALERMEQALRQAGVEERSAVEG